MPLSVKNAQSAAYAAAAVFESSRKLACVNVIGGPGITHALGGIARAKTDEIPMLVLTTGIKTGRAYEKRSFQVSSVNFLPNSEK